jgi:hypothetical protein
MAIVLPIGGVPVTRSQSGEDDRCRYFARTGHYVCDEFLEYFESRGGLEIFGYPLSEPFEDLTHEGLWVQYFQRARMEWHPDNPIPYQVQLGLLVDELGHRYPPASPDEIPAPDDAAHQYFPETKHVVSYAFLDTFREKGGLDIFGYPRSEFMYEAGKIVQYFQRARMEWDRKREGQPVLLAKVGEMYIERFGIPPKYRARVDENRYGEPSMTRPAAKLATVFLPLVAANAEPRMPPATMEPAEPSATVEPSGPTPTAEPSAPTPTAEPSGPPATAPSVPVSELQVSASVRYPITGQTGTQTAFIYVNDQEARPIGGATAQVVVHYPWGDLDCTPQPTDAAGFTWCSFEIISPTPGEEVLIDIEVAYHNLKGKTQTFFMPWW